MIPRFRPIFSRAEAAASLRIGKPDDVSRFERAFAQEMEQDDAVAFPYGRTALMFLLEALGISGKEIICPAYTCVVVAHAITLSGNTPVFIDSGPDCNMDLDAAEARISAKTGAIIPTSIFGHPVDLDRLDALRLRWPDLPIIQDCAHSFAAQWRGRSVQTVGTAAIFGLNASKLVNSIFGGMVTTDDLELAESLRRLRDSKLVPAPWSKSLHRFLYVWALYVAFTPLIVGLVHRLTSLGLLDAFTKYYDEDKIDMPSDYLVQMSPIEGRVGAIQIKRQKEFIDARRRYAKAYRDGLSDLPGLAFPQVPKGTSFSHIVALVHDRERVISEAARHGVQLGWVLEYCIPLMAAYRHCVGDWPVAQAYAQHIINLPVSGRFNEGAANKVIRVMRNVLEKSEPPRQERERVGWS